MYRAGCARRNATKLQSGEGYARGGRVAMSRVEGRMPPGGSVEPSHEGMPMPRGMPAPAPHRAPRRGR
jgi:hypothetical protein